MDFAGTRTSCSQPHLAKEEFRIQNSDLEDSLEDGHGGVFKGGRRKREAPGLRKAESRTAVTKQLSEDRIQNSLGLPAEFKPGGLTTHTASRIHSCRYI